MTLLAVGPRVMHVPGYVSTSGREAVELCEMAGLFLDPWQQDVLVHSLGEQANGKWSAFEVGIMLSRQNGKGAILEARELTGLFLLGERLIIHSAHEFSTSLEAFRRLLFLIENTPDLSRRVKRVSNAHGDEGLELLGGQRIRFRTRTKGGGRGFTGDCLILDEAMVLPDAFHAALMPTVSAKSMLDNPQIWYTGSAVDQSVMHDGLVFARVRERGIKGEDPRLAFFEWAVDARDDQGVPLSPDHLGDEIAGNEDAWLEANPAMGIRISAGHIEMERRSMSPRSFAVERLGVGDWPATDGQGEMVIDLEQWDALIDVGSETDGPVCFAFDIAPDRSYTSISVAGRRADGLRHVEVVDGRRGTGWVVARLAQLNADHSPVAIVCDASGPAASLLPALADLGIEPLTVTAPEQGKACGIMYDLVEQGELRHLGSAEIRAALRGAAKRPLGDAWAWSRKNSTVDISPLVASTLALWGAATAELEEEPLIAWSFV